jgi:hypothetical protein
MAASAACAGAGAGAGCGAGLAGRAGAPGRPNSDIALGSSNRIRMPRLAVSADSITSTTRPSTRSSSTLSPITVPTGMGSPTPTKRPFFSRSSKDDARPMATPA